MSANRCLTYSLVSLSFSNGLLGDLAVLLSEIMVNKLENGTYSSCTSLASLYLQTIDINI